MNTPSNAAIKAANAIIDIIPGALIFATKSDWKKAQNIIQSAIDAAVQTAVAEATGPLVGALRNIVLNHEAIEDPRTEGLTDCAAVSLDDIEKAEELLAALAPEPETEAQS